MALVVATLVLSLQFVIPSHAATDPRGIQFIAFKSFSKFTKSPGESVNETVWTSPEITARIHWDELIVSWNVEMT